ncbi:AMP-binding protein [Leucobacter luti]|uniref:Crotonobetaine/carnitine-CoA ligase n=1 Tax=Leucobacter luti TaxID=340320 RepID=A0A4V6MDP4_9MICO|nr:AMP-binding protein [Leucobacter luti]MBL3701000.1 ATP-dependent acyl-CoA ligase [Leucobacter luti]RZT68779.1 crotonobetaine/carnitine-CoA ligase [Leucobacter luti]
MTDIAAPVPAERTVPWMLQRAAETHGSAPLFSFGDASASYQRACEIAGHAAWRLTHQYGVRRGDTIVLILHNRVEFLEIVLGAAWAGAVSVPLNTAAMGEQLRHMLESAAANVIVVEQELAVRVRDALAAVSATPRLVVLTDPAARVTRGSENSVDAWEPISHGPVTEPRLPPASVRPGDPFVVLYTSGTTGVSKGVVCPHAQYYWWAYHNASLLELGPTDVLFTTLPLFHTNALSALFQAARVGASVVYERRFSASGFVDAIERAGATVTYLLGAMVPILLTVPPRPEDRESPLRRVLAPGVPEVQLREFEQRFGARIVDGFASTESNFVIGSRVSERRPGRMGTVQRGFEARVVDPNDAEVPDGTPGELVLRSREPFAFALGYRGRHDATVESWRNLWLHTGDRVVRDADGFFSFVDRLKDVIRRRGENISSHEVEAAVLTHQEVEAVAAFPVPSELAEDEVMIAVVRGEGDTLTPAALLDHVRTRLAYFAVPRFVDFVDELPLTENGKVRKFVLREQGVSPDTWDREAAGYELRRDGS